MAEHLARLLHDSGYQVGAIYNQTSDKAQLLAKQVGAKVVARPTEVSSLVDLVFLTISDDGLTALASELAQGIVKGRGFVHTSGVYEHSVLSQLSEYGAMIGGLHPIFPFADIESSVIGLPGKVFGIQADEPKLRLWLNEIVVALKGTALFVPSGRKALYHCALVFASNYGVTLFAIAQRILLSLGSDKAIADRALSGLFGGMAKNVRVQGIPEALTGPLTRADSETVRAHMAELIKFDQELAELYRRLAVQSMPMLEERGIDTDWIANALLGSKSDAD